ncbi:GNAT family N-acetyltransferase [Vibrio sp. FNV 38]|nr:GNAT family N-acetyltransferase [Vibrio sp. FNV 38]
MSVVIRHGSLQEVVSVIAQIKEFARGESVASLAQRLDDKQDVLILVAEDNKQLLGFKIGYQVDQHVFYSWLGGVSPIARKKGVAQQLLDWQEAWVCKHNYSDLKVKSRNQFPGMLRLLIRNGYQIEDYERMDPIEESRIHFTKMLIDQVR